jgi:phosphoglucomutase
MAKIPLSDPVDRPSEQQLDELYSRLILSASGWRAVFAAGGQDEGRDAGIGPARTVVAAHAAKVFADFLKTASGTSAPTVLLGMDTRPTGPAVADAMARAFLANGVSVRFLGVVAAPEIMAYARHCGSPAAGSAAADGFAYISASHNPIGHNGLKFGLTDGGVLAADAAGRLTAAFRAGLEASGRIEAAAAWLAAADPARLAAVFAGAAAAKAAALRAYLDFTRRVVSGAEDAAGQAAALDAMAAGLADRPVGIVADFNGSARAASLDREFLSGLGVRFRSMNDVPGAIAHRIVPEGESLEPCRLALEAEHRVDGSYALGYVPDCDGDRGNVVVWDEAAGRARSLEAQEVFALCCVAELAHLVWTGELSYLASGAPASKVAVAVNDPTSMRVDDIARAFGVSVFRAEVGEANVVGLARRLRSRGYLVRILGEGAAGGNITYPSAVRDPIDTVSALLKLLTLRSEPGRPGLFEIWLERSGRSADYKNDFGMADVIASLPAYATTSAYEPEAGLRIGTTDHARLKSRYQQVFLAEWPKRRAELAARWGIVSWRALIYNGMEETADPVDFGQAGKGGLKLLFADAAGESVAYIWMRGSGTEPIFRISADASGGRRELERELLEWQRRMIGEADSFSA